jgi:hypothetical protein
VSPCPPPPKKKGKSRSTPCCTPCCTPCLHLSILLLGVHIVYVAQHPPLHVPLHPPLFPWQLGCVTPPVEPPLRNALPLLHAGFNLRSLGRLWTGGGATLARDVPFSALYWLGVEPIRDALLVGREQTELQVLVANLSAGGASGWLAAAVTTPLDVVKTRKQLTEGPHPSTLGMIRRIAAQEGWQALFSGVGPRAAKAAPACAIVLSAYELLKHMHLAAIDG